MGNLKNLKDQLRAVHEKLLQAGWFTQVIETDGEAEDGCVGLVLSEKGQKHINNFGRLHADLAEFTDEEMETLYRYLAFLASRAQTGGELDD